MFSASRTAISLALVVLVSPQITAAAPAPYSVDDVLSAPFVDGLAASPHRDALVWTVHERGARNVVVWKDGAVREVTNSTDDDGEALAEARRRWSAFKSAGHPVSYWRQGETSGWRQEA